jgi:hypothetical protein
LIGLIAKIGLFFAAIIVALLVVLNMTNVWNPGTLRWTAPSVEPCRRYVAATFPRSEPQIVEVRWIWSAKNYGWGCHFEFGNLDVRTVSPMPE